MEKKLAAVKESAAANKAALRKYTWTETLGVSAERRGQVHEGDDLRLRANGQVVRTPVGPPPEQKKTGPIRGRIIEQKKKEEMTDLMQSVKALIGLYVPPRLRPDAGGPPGGESLVQPAGGGGGGAPVQELREARRLDGPRLFDGDEEARRLERQHLPGRPVAARYARRPVRNASRITSYPASEVINVPAQAIQVNITNSNYQKLAGQ